MLILNMFMYYLAISTNSLIIYIYLRLNMLPFIIYINNILYINITNYLSKNINHINYSIFSINMFKSITFSRLFIMISFISLFAFLSINIQDFILRMDNPGSGGNTGGNPGGGNSGGNPGPVWNPINIGGSSGGNSGGNTGPETNSGSGGSSSSPSVQGNIVGNPYNTNDQENTEGNSYAPMDQENTGANSLVNVARNPAPDLDIIKAKVRWRANNIIHRNAPIYKLVPDNQFDCNLTQDEINFLNQKVIDRGLNNTRPFALLKLKGGVNEGTYRIVRLRKNETYPTPTNTCPVRATAEFRRFLDTL